MCNKLHTSSHQHYSETPIRLVSKKILT